MTQIPYIDRLEDELVSAIHNQRRRRRAQTRLAMTIVVLVAVVGGSLLVLDPSTSTVAAATVVNDGSDITITITDVEADPEAVRDAIERASAPVTIKIVPTSPSKAGRFIGSEHAEDAPDFEPMDMSGTTFTALRIPAGTTAQVTILLGRQAEPHEAYATPADAFAPGEALGCSDLKGATVAEALPRLAALDLNVRWNVYDGTNLAETDDPADIALTTITDARAVSDSTVLIYTSSTHESPFLEPQVQESREACE